ncbi:ABC transporter ATP-binding protein [uncultured Methanocorpusculum sp.]|nr:ABC transporter ATP-binding protein [uncultured Methanocorpusculum sp.]
MDSILDIEDLSVGFDTPDGEVQAVRGVSFSLKRGEILAVIGESGCGKSVLCQSILKLLPKNGHIKSGKILVDGIDITDFKEKDMKNIRGNLISMVFQDPLTTLNPTMPIGKQITEALLKHKKISKEEAKKRAIEMLELIGIDNPEQRYSLQPYFFSGGMRQRCVLAIALALEPMILFADEPTTALDVTVQAKIIDLLLDLRDKLGLSIVFISHDLGVVARIADRVAIMYAGKIVEIGNVDEIFYDPRHPYTWCLMQSHPTLAKEGEPLKCIPGIPPIMLNPPKGDMFAYRSRYAMKIDFEKMPPMFQVSPTHFAATWLLDEHAPKIDPPVSLKVGEAQAE